MGNFFVFSFHLLTSQTQSVNYYQAQSRNNFNSGDYGIFHDRDLETNKPTILLRYEYFAGKNMIKSRALPF